MSTELINPKFEQVDQWATIEAVDAMLEEQQAALAAIKGQTAIIAEAAEAAAQRLGAQRAANLCRSRNIGPYCGAGRRRITANLRLAQRSSHLSDGGGPFCAGGERGRRRR